MKFGINQENLTVKCANCGKVISRNGIIDENYCSNCGAPLSALSIADYSEILKDENKAMLNALVEISKKNNTDSFVEILEIYNKM